jgi:hypothetical protein
MRARSKPLSVFLTALFCGGFLCAVGEASVGSYSVPGTSNPFLSGMPSGSTCCSGDSAPAEFPVFAGPATAGETFTFTNVTGRVANAPGAPSEPPDGGSRFGTPPNEGGLSSINDIAGFYRMPLDALLGVFLGPGLPTSNPAPGVLNFRDIGVARFGTQVGTHFATLSPDLQQIFFIGDGLTGMGSGSVQTFIAPTGATRLYLGVADGYGWANNTGAFDVCVNCGLVPDRSAGSVVPEPSTWAMMLLGFGGLGFGGYVRSKKNRLAVLAA